MVAKLYVSAVMFVILMMGCFGLFGIATGKKVLPKDVSELSTVDVTVKSLNTDTKAVTLETEEYPDTIISLMPSSPFSLTDTPDSSLQAGDKVKVSLNKNELSKLGNEKSVIAYELALPNGSSVIDSREIIEGFSSPIMDYLRKASYAAVIIPIFYFLGLIFYPMLRARRR